jgi:hypothetical protein
VPLYLVFATTNGGEAERRIPASADGCGTIRSPMRRKTEAQHEVVAAVRVYLDDAERIRDLLAEKCEKVTLETSGYEFDDPEELKKLGRHRVSELVIYGRRPYLRIMIRPAGASLFAPDGDAVSLGLLVQARKYLAATSPWWGFLARRYLALTWLVSALLVVGTILIEFVPETWPWAAVPSVAIPFWLLLLYAHFRGSKVYLVRRAAEPPFLSRNKDRLFTGLIVAVVTVGLTAVTTYFLTAR